MAFLLQPYTICVDCEFFTGHEADPNHRGTPDRAVIDGYVYRRDDFNTVHLRQTIHCPLALSWRCWNSDECMGYAETRFYRFYEAPLQHQTLLVRHHSHRFPERLVVEAQKAYWHKIEFDTTLYPEMFMRLGRNSPAVSSNSVNCEIPSTCKVSPSETSHKVEKTKNRVKDADRSSTKRSSLTEKRLKPPETKKRTASEISAVESHPLIAVKQERTSPTGEQTEGLSMVTSSPVTLLPSPSVVESDKMADEDSTQHSQSSRSSTPNVSNPGTPRQELAQEVRATPPLAVPSTSAIQRTIPGQAQPQSIPPPPAAATAAAATAAATAAAMATPPQQQGVHPMSQLPQSKYSSLLAVIEDMGRDIRPTYAGNRTSSERLKRSIVHARILVRECLMECERSART